METGKLMSREEVNSVVLAWCEMKLAECDQRVAMAQMVGMERTAATEARDARFFRAVIGALTSGSDKADAKEESSRG